MIHSRLAAMLQSFSGNLVAFNLKPAAYLEYITLFIVEYHEYYFHRSRYSFALSQTELETLELNTNSDILKLYSRYSG